MPNKDYYLPEESFNIMDSIVVLAKQIKVILITPVFICAGAIIYVSFFVPNVYESNAKIISFTSSGGNSISQVSGLAAQFGISLSNSQPGQQMIYSDLVKSRTMARKMLKRKFDTKRYGPEKTLFEILVGDAKTGLDTLEIEAIQSVIQMISLSEDARTGIFDLKVSTFEPEFAHDLVATLIEELDMHQRDYQNKQIGDARIFIENRIEEKEKELNKAEEVLKEFRERNRRIENSPGLLLEQQRLAREVAVLTSVFTTLKQQLETTKIEEVKDSDYVIVLDRPEAPLERTSPRKKRAVIIAGFLGIFLGIFLAIIKGYFDNIYKKEKKIFDKIKKMLYENILDLIPNFFKK